MSINLLHRPLRLLSYLGALPGIAGIAVALLGFAALLGWLTANTAWVQVRADFAPIQGNAAIGLLLCGGALLSLQKGWRRLPEFLGLIIAALGFLTLCQYGLNLDFGIDQLLFKHSIVIHTSHPGRMAPNTAVGFLAAGLACLLACRLFFMAALLGSLVFALGAVAFLGYVFGVPSAFAWGGFTHMALLTALGFCGLGIGVVSFACQRQEQLNRPRLPWMPVLAGTTAAIVGILFWYALRTQELEHLQHTIDATALGVRSAIVARIDAITTALEDLTEVGIRRGWESRTDWQTDARLTVSAFPGLARVEWIDKALEVRVVSPGPEAQRLNKNRYALRLLREAVELARATRGPVVTGPFFFADGETALRVLVPVIAPGRPEAYLAGVFAANDIFADVFKTVAPGYSIALWSGYKAILRHDGNSAAAVEPLRTRTLFLDLPGGLAWRMTVAPQAGEHSVHYTPLPEVVLGASLIIALLLGLTIRFGEKATLRAQHFATAVRERTAELEAENAERRRSQQTLQRIQSVSRLVSAELNLEKVVQTVVDAATELTGAAFGTFIYRNVNTPSRSYKLYTFSEASGGVFAELTQLSDPDVLNRLFRGKDVLRLNDVSQDSASGGKAPCHELVNSRLPMGSYLAAPVISRTRQLLGVLFLGHPEPAAFTKQAEQIVSGIAAQAAIAVDNAQLFQQAQQEIVARKQAEEALQHKTEQLAEADRRKDIFLAMLGHELRNPLGSIRNALAVLALRPEDETVEMRMQEILQRQVNQLARLVDDLLDVARIEQGKLALHCERLDLVSLISEVLEPERVPIQAAGLSLEVDLPDKPLWVNADPMRLSQVFSNLLANARKFTPRAGSIRVRLEADAQDPYAKVVVTDTGCGIDPQQLSSIFVAFQQSHTASQHKIQGLGLGLAIAKGLVEAHDGRLEAYSKGQGQGTEFTVSLPKQTAPVEQSDGLQTTRDARACQRILVIDDHRDSAKGLSELLTLYGHEVEVAFDGPAALQAAVRFHPDIVICDIGLPDMDGYQIAQALQQHSQTAGVRLFALTGYGDDATIRRVRAAGFAHHLMKPINPTELNELLASVSAGKVFT